MKDSERLILKLKLKNVYEGVEPSNPRFIIFLHELLLKIVLMLFPGANLLKGF